MPQNSMSAFSSLSSDTFEKILSHFEPAYPRDVAENIEYRIEHDTMGEVRVPADALYRAQTQRAVGNFRFLARPRIRPYSCACP